MKVKRVIKLDIQAFLAVHIRSVCFLSARFQIILPVPVPVPD